MNLPVACEHVFLICMCAFCGSEAARCISLWDGGQVRRRGRRGRFEGLEVGQETWEE